MGPLEDDVVPDRHYYRCPCGKLVGWRYNPTANPLVRIEKRMHDYDFGVDEIEVPRDFTCACGRAYDGSGTWHHESEIPNIEAPVSMHVVKPEIPPHFNPAFGCEVESRAHLEHLQRVHGCEDAENVGRHLIDSNGALPDTPTNATTAHAEKVSDLEKKFEAGEVRWGDDSDDADLADPTDFEGDPIVVPSRRQA